MVTDEGFLSRLQRSLDPVAEELEQLRSERYKLKTQLDEIDSQVVILEKILKVVNPPEKTKSRKAYKKAGVSPERIDQIFQVFKEHPDREFTVQDFQEQFGWAPSNVRAAIVSLRDASAVNLVRYGGYNNKQEFYKLDLREKEDE